MHPDYRSKVDKKFSRKIERMVRKRPKKDEPQEAASPCPHCGAAVKGTVLECPSCKNVIPYCIISGMHMTSTDWSFCPSCQFPARHTFLMKYLDHFSDCPMCGQTISKDIVELVVDPTDHIKRQLDLNSTEHGDEVTA